MCLRTQSSTKLIYQKLTKSIIRRRLIQGVYTREKYLCKNLWVKEGGGRLLKGGVFSGTYSISHITAQVFNHLQYTETEGEG